MEKLIIKNFAGIKSLEIELNKINLLIGPQASGKSIIAKLFYYFKYFFQTIENATIEQKNKREIDREHINRFITFFPKDTWSAGYFSIEYKFDNMFIKIFRNGNGNKTLKFEYSEHINKIIKLAKERYKNIQQEKKSNSISKLLIDSFYKFDFYQIVKKEISTNFSYNQIFIPAGRSFFSILQSNIFSLLSINKALDPFLIQFGSLYEHFKINITHDIDDNIDSFHNTNEIIHNILNSKYFREKEKDYLLHNDKRRVDLSYASSGQQEILPLLLILRALLNKPYENEGIVLYIEEPEAHLFPNSQKMVIELLARIFNKFENKLQIILTTHSPYILSSFNNLMYAGNLENSFKEKEKNKIYNIIRKDEIISPENVSAFALKYRKGKHTLIDLIDKETSLIAQNLLDDVSNEISVDFGKLLELESDL